MLQTDMISTLTLGESAIVNGHHVVRVGLAGPAAYTVDGEHLPLELAELFAARPLGPVKPPVRRARPASPPKPDLYVETQQAVGARRLFGFKHRVWPGGEAVEVRYRGRCPSRDTEVTELGTALVQIMTSGLYVEWSGDRKCLIVTWRREVLAPAPKPPAKLAAA